MSLLFDTLWNCVTIALALVSWGTGRDGHSGGTKYLFIFGDSYTSSGWGMNSPVPSLSNPVGFASEVKWPEILATTFNRSLTMDYDFAVGGAGVDPSIIPSIQPIDWSVSAQMRDWTELLGTTPRPDWAQWTSTNSLFGVWVGINDVMMDSGPDSDIDKLDRSQDRLFELLEDKYTSGARNFFLMTIPPLWRTPDVIADNEEHRALITTLLTHWNDRLPTMTAAFSAAHPDIAMAIVDTHPPFNAAIDDPQKYGAPDATCLYEDDPSCLWWNGFHPGLPIQKLIAQTVAESLKGDFF